LHTEWTCRFTEVKGIIQLKKTITLGVLPNTFNIVANKLQELEGTFTDGFSNNITHLLDQQNWQKKNCIQGKPQVALVRHITQYAYDLHCFPIIAGEPQAMVEAFHPRSGFKQFNPAITGPLIRIPQLESLIETYLKCGDEADLELIKYAHILVEQLGEYLQQKMLVTQNSGQSVQEVLMSAEQLKTSTL
jgi:hypothetical protein